MTVVSLLWPLAICLVLLGGIGGFLSWAVGLRGYSAAALAPAFAVTLISGTAIVASWAGVPFSVLPVVVLTAIIGAVIYAVRRRLGISVPDRSAGEARSRTAGQGAWLTVVLVMVALVMTLRVMQIIGEPDRISQTFDNVFHLNGIRYVLSEGDASSLRLGYMTSPDGTLPFYPAAWHGVTALVVQISGAAIPVAVNAVVVAVSAVVWPLSAVFLVRTLFGRSLAFAVPAALLAVSLPGFPILPMDYGVLYPFQLSLALMPLALAAAVRVLRLGHDVSSWNAGWWALVLVGVIPGLALAHPGGFVAWVVLTVPVVAASVVRGLRRARSPRRRVAILAGAVVYVAAGVLVLLVLRPPEEARGWPLQLRIRESALQAATISFWYAVPAIVAAVCVLIGVVWSLAGRRSGALIALGMYAIGVGLFMTVASMPWPELRDQLTGSWYNNLPRLGAILAVVLVPIGAYGVARTWQWVSRHARFAGRPVLAAGVGGVAAIALFGGLQYDGAMDRAVQSASSVYRLDAASPLLSDDEYRLLERIPQEVPEGVAIAGSVWTGASLASAISDRPILMPHTLMQISEPVELINAELDRAEVGSAVCDAVHQLNVGYVLDFGDLEIHGGHHAMPGLESLDTSPAVELVDREGDAALYRVVGCG